MADIAAKRPTARPRTRKVPPFAPDLVSVNDVDSIATYERPITMTDPQRITALALLTNAQQVAALAQNVAQRGQFWSTRWGRAALVLGALASISVIGGEVYSTFFGLAHSVLHSVPLSLPTPTP